jgi:hypothetical protein
MGRGAPRPARLTGSLTSRALWILLRAVEDGETPGSQVNCALRAEALKSRRNRQPNRLCPGNEVRFVKLVPSRGPAPSSVVTESWAKPEIMSGYGVLSPNNGSIRKLAAVIKLRDGETNGRSSSSPGT